MTFSNGSTIAYTYDANGRKLRTVHNVGGTTTTTDYAGNVIYENGVQKKLLTEEGYVDLTSGTYYYYLKDHQGNNRVVVNGSGAVTETNHYYPFGGTFASGTVQPYKYNGKELDTKGGLNWYDYGARHYDAALGRFLTVDPLAEKMMLWSPYGYCLNNPIKYVDKDGEVPRIYVETKGLGHTFITTGSGKNTIVYTYGRYGSLEGNKSSAQSLSRNGQGVLIIMKGDEAVDYLRKEVLNKEASVYEITKGHDEEIDKFFNDIFNSSKESPSEGSYKNRDNAKVIDTYDLWNNNCTTKSVEAIKVGTKDKIDLKSFSPSNIYTQLYYESKKEISDIKRININEIIEEYDLYEK